MVFPCLQFFRAPAVHVSREAGVPGPAAGAAGHAHDLGLCPESPATDPASVTFEGGHIQNPQVLGHFVHFGTKLCSPFGGLNAE